MLAMAGLCITALILVFFIRRLDWDEFSAAFFALRTPWLLAACAAIVLTVAVRALRWQRLAGSHGGFKPFWDATVLGYVGNVIYPARAGEALRVAAICRSARLGLGHAVTSAFADRLADVFVLGAVALLVLGLEKLGPQDHRVFLAVLLLSTLPVLVFVAFLRWGAKLSSWLSSVAHRLPRALAEPLPRWLAQAVDQTSILRTPRVLGTVLGLTLVATFLDYLSIWFVMHAMSWSLPLLAAVLVGVLLAIGTLIPAAPGYVGIYQVACVLALARYEISEAAALAFSVVLQGVVLGAIILQALGVFAHYGWRWREFQLAKNKIALANEFDDHVRR